LDLPKDRQTFTKPWRQPETGISLLNAQGGFDPIKCLNVGEHLVG